ncbi:DUF4270 family protein [Emticicia aquatica]|jgi:hypothetical protein|nr:DUF4270 family protein [Emticicia aquatica]
MLFSAFFFSCQDPIGIVIDTPSTGGQITTIFTDTVKINASTLMLDSTFTSGQSSAVVGHYIDPVLGEVTAKTFAQITLPVLSTETFTSLVFPDADKGLTVYDSIYVYVAHNGFAYGDTTKNYNLQLHRLNEDFVKSKRYTKDDVLSYNSTPLASKTFTYKDLKRAYSATQDSLLIFKLPNEVGQQIYDLVGTDTGADIDKFTAAIKGLAFVTDQNSENAFGISVSGSYVQLYYHTTNSTDRKSIPLTFYSQRFSQIQGKKQGTILQNLQLLQPLSSSLTNNRTFVQSGLGIVTKLDFPTLAVLQKAGNVTINKAELIFEPDLDQVSGNYKTPKEVALVQLESTNQIKKTTSNLIDFVALDGLSGTQYVADYNATTNSYTFNFTSFLQDFVTNKLTTKGIALVPSLLNTTTSTISIYNSDVSRMVIKNIKLNVYYSIKK